MIASLVPISEKTREHFFSKTGETLHNILNVKEEAHLLPKVEVLISKSQIDRSVLDQLTGLKMIYVLSAGVEVLPFELLIERNIIVANARGVHSAQMSEHALGVMLSFSRMLHKCILNQSRGVWDPRLTFSSLEGKTLGIIGAGHIGQGVAKKAAAFGMRILGVKRNGGTLEGFDRIYGTDALKDVLAQSDYVLLLTPLTKETYHLIGPQEFEVMRESAVFINMSRGDTVDESALIDALREKKIAGAALDVFHNEPLEPESPFWSMENVIVTPHVSGIVPRYVDLAMNMFLPNFTAYRKGEKMPTQVSLQQRY